MKLTMKPSAARKADGWAPVLEYSNGGRREMCRARYGTQDEAIAHAAELGRAYVRRPDLCRPPRPNSLLEH